MELTTELKGNCGIGDLSGFTGSPHGAGVISPYSNHLVASFALVVNI